MRTYSGAFIAFMVAFAVSSLYFSMTSNADNNLISEVAGSLSWLVSGLGQ